MTADDARKIAEQRLNEWRIKEEQRKKEKIAASREKYREVFDRIYTELNNRATEYRLKYNFMGQSSEDINDISSVLIADGFQVDIESYRPHHADGILIIKWAPPINQNEQTAAQK